MLGSELDVVKPVKEGANLERAQTFPRAPYSYLSGVDLYATLEEVKLSAPMWKADTAERRGDVPICTRFNEFAIPRIQDRDTFYPGSSTVCFISPTCP